jgi:hypothetical protein
VPLLLEGCGDVIGQLNGDPHEVILPPNFCGGAEVQEPQDGTRRRAEGVTPVLPP